MKKIKKHSRLLFRLLALGMIFVLALSIASITKAGQGNNNQNGEVKVKICHRDKAAKKPYVSIEVAASSVDGDNANDKGQGDHLLEHTGPVFDPATMNQHSSWGDIIPPFDVDGNSYDNPQTSLNWPGGKTIWENDCNIEVTGQPLVLTSICSDKTGLSRWNVSNPNTKDINFSYEVYPVNGGSVLEKGSDKATAFGDTVFETKTAGDIKAIIYWDKTNSGCVSNLDSPKCTTSTPTPTPNPKTPTPTPKITPTVLGTSTPASVGGVAETLPTTGANDVSLYWIATSGILGLSYYLKKKGWLR